MRSAFCFFQFLVEDCEIPMFLKEKLYADFRTDFDFGLKALVDSLAKVTNADQGRLVSGRVNTDWAEIWGDHKSTGLFGIEYTLTEATPDLPFTILTNILVTCNEAATKRYQQYESAGLDWLGRMIITEAVAEFAESADIRSVLRDQFPLVTAYTLVDSKSDVRYEIEVRCQRLGEDNGKDQLVNVKNYLIKVRDQARGRLRKLSQEESARLAALLSKR
jgi:hypothetical protein